MVGCVTGWCVVGFDGSAFIVSITFSLCEPYRLCLFHSDTVSVVVVRLYDVCLYVCACVHVFVHMGALLMFSVVCEWIDVRLCMCVRALCFGAKAPSIVRRNYHSSELVHYKNLFVLFSFLCFDLHSEVHFSPVNATYEFSTIEIFI